MFKLQNTVSVRTALLVAAPCLFAVLGVLLGKKTGWDLFNYHWYNPYALLNGRFGFDIAVGHNASYYNPLADLPLYFVGNYAPAWMVGAMLGAMAGIQVALIGAIAYQVLPLKKYRMLIAAALGLSSALGAGAFQEIGDPANDIQAAIGCFAALWLLLWKFEQLQKTELSGAAMRILAIAGIFSGAAVGLKLTTAVYAFGTGIALLVLRGRIVIRLSRAALFAIGALIGLLITNGFWMWQLWLYSGNPFFPYFNDLFQSPLLIAANYRDPSFFPHDWRERLLFPLLFTIDSRHASESLFRDAHILVAYILIPITAALALFRRLRSPSIVDPRVAGFLFVFAAASYVAWLTIFDIYRYLIPLEMLTPVLIVLALMLWRIPDAVRIAAAVILFAVLQALVKVDLSDRQSWAGSYVAVDVPDIPNAEQSMILMTGHAPMSFVIPYFPRDIPFIRIDGWLVQGTDRETGLALAMRARVAAHGGPMWVMFAGDEIDAASKAMTAYDLQFAVDRSCKTVSSNLTNAFLLCAATKRNEPAS